MLDRPGSAAARIIPAIDTADPARAEVLAAALAPGCGALKLGLELFTAEGPEAVRRIAPHAPVFLDLKLHDIPNTVAGAVRSLLPLRPAMLTLHAGGGAAMITAAREAAEAAGAARPILLAVTVLTSIDAATLAETGVAGGTVQQVLRLARLALAAGADGLVCSPQEVARIRDAFGQAPMLVVPGVRPAGSALGDQARVATPAEAVAAGADWLVIGRPITGAADPAAALSAIVAGLPA
ncbi:orotidine 5'-phosphate decarboxylase [Siccirubricoccus deserti]|uniref:Orotidine 5'-phosphate decarboxylase n=1 Tax=Siccirubricoccus deserti TaxID=2013562 RepID=A0A9X0R0Y1_9PROT|nr:orotidine-5'-phosphate decarboxylase [Siccirubricoccus deserti]MBC4016777.1 orotidine-5'-phosphate decarboxylase [Siccirubricoccus deserti]GGC51420.1 orotidine 5'-phosphate decarboxylase [Siccirubricoccus deserti]